MEVPIFPTPNVSDVTADVRGFFKSVPLSQCDELPMMVSHAYQSAYRLFAYRPKTSVSLETRLETSILETFVCGYRLGYQCLGYQQKTAVLWLLRWLHPLGYRLGVAWRTKSKNPLRGGP